MGDILTYFGVDDVRKGEKKETQRAADIGEWREK
jgi:hypothetical protein